MDFCLKNQDHAPSWQGYAAVNESPAAGRWYGMSKILQNNSRRNDDPSRRKCHIAIPREWKAWRNSKTWALARCYCLRLEGEIDCTRALMIFSHDWTGNVSLSRLRSLWGFAFPKMISQSGVWETHSRPPDMRQPPSLPQPSPLPL